MVKGGESGAPKAETNAEKESPEAELKRLKKLLEDLDQKETYLKSDPKRLKEAEESGWFADAAMTREKINKRINELKLQLNQN